MIIALRRLAGELWAAQVPYAYSVQTNAALAFGRLLVAVELLPNGISKIVDFHKLALAIGGAPQFVHGRLFPDQHPLLIFRAPELFLGLSLGLDLAGSVLLIVGYKTRAASCVLLGYVAIAMAIFHSDIRGAEDLQQLLRNLPFIAGLLILSGTGAGALSVDGSLRRSGLMKIEAPAAGPGARHHQKSADER